MTTPDGPATRAAEWTDATRQALTTALGAERTAALLERWLPALPAGYDELNRPNSAALDLSVVDRTADPANPAVAAAMMQFDGSAADEWRFRAYQRGAPIALADLLPLLDQLGFRVLEERPFRFVCGDVAVWVHDVGVRLPAGVVLHGSADASSRRAEVERAFLAEVAGEIDVDGFNRLVLTAGLSVREAAVLRAYGRYLRQTPFPFSQPYVEGVLMRHPTITAALRDCIAARFDPAAIDDGDGADAAGRSARDTHWSACRAAVLAALDDVPSLDDDRTVRTLLALVEATVRTNVFRRADDGGHPPVMAFKFDAARVPDLPLPRPMFEIWVCSPEVEGVHLRNGRIARGGIRWSDRPEDFRTEVLGLVKAQIVKNAVIVPTGAKGGFVVKRTVGGDTRAAGTHCYRRFVEGMLDLTDNIVGGEIVGPPHTVCHDGPDPYLVVAADKGTATFSDLANEVAAEYGFWLGDAFASGGSQGYDHKAMGITARGAWESVRRHAAVLGRDADRDPLTVVGIGDMSGDVFGNGLLRSANLLLIAAFDHRHVFLDPSPDAAAAFAERQRLFGLERSSWDDYDRAVISVGGGVWPRSAKSVPVSEQVRRRLGIVTDATSMTPTELIGAILRAPVDLLWNGGIGTYVKSAGESHAEVGDRANDAVRVNGAELRCRMVAEGGNLGVTQRGRVEFALAGGLIATDAIDNSAGVDCSDHEVNIKILLDAAVEEGRMTVGERNTLLAEMTDEVAELVLADNRAQTLALAIARRQSLPMVNVHSRYLTLLETEGWVNRALEFLPTDRQLAERQAQGSGLSAPEFAVLLAYTKTANVAEMSASTLPDDPWLVGDLARYFPVRLGSSFGDLVERHRLRREIVATQVCNQMANLSGISFDHRVGEKTGLDVVEIIRAWVAARDILDLEEAWREVVGLDGRVRLDVQIDLFLELRSMAERVTLWLLRHRRLPVDIAAAVERYRSGIRSLLSLEGTIRGPLRDATFALEAGRLAAGVPETLAQHSVQWRLLHTGLDMIEIADRRACPVAEVCAVYWHVFDILDLTWLWDAVGALPRSSRWQNQARAALRDDLVAALADLADDALAAGGADAWRAAHERLVTRSGEMFTDLRRVDAHDLTTLSVAVRQLRTLALLG